MPRILCPFYHPTFDPTVSMSTTTDEILFSFGDILYRNDVPHSVGFTFFGIYLVFFCVYLWFTMHHPMKSRASKILLAAMLLLFLSSTTQFVLDMTFSLEQIKGYLMWTDVPLADRRNLWLQKYEVIFILERWPTATNFMISDLIVIWRASVMYSHRRWVQGALWTVAVADVVLWICASSFTSRDATQRSRNPTTDEQLNTIGNFVSLGTNLLGTGLIAVKGWRQRKLMTQASLAKWRGDVPRILLVLVETGAVWAVIQLVFSILQQIDQANFTSVDLAVAVIGKAALYLAAILPTATVIIVRSQRSVEYTLNFGNVSDFRAAGPKHTSTRLSTIRFGENPTASKDRATVGAVSVQSSTDGEPRGDGIQMDRDLPQEKPLNTTSEEMV
ncbi:hypothetical protein B0H10DRAFT_2436582 [Mycena sp. CBHHK59/15]|nr:hypothetical protein B0H10DRAFT_2436582 [Mycena sp. CBHHK59/15]